MPTSPQQGYWCYRLCENQFQILVEDEVSAAMLFSPALTPGMLCFSASW